LVDGVIDFISEAGGKLPTSQGWILKLKAGSHCVHRKSRSALFGRI
jgi:hypothetical protein